jgi:Superinfection immunity protein
MEALSKIILLLVWAGIALVLYVLPTLRAYHVHHPQRQAILALNVLAGWTFLGWVGAFVWACIRTSDDLPPRP